MSKRSNTVSDKVWLVICHVSQIANSYESKQFWATLIDILYQTLQYRSGLQHKTKRCIDVKLNVYAF